MCGKAARRADEWATVNQLTAELLDAMGFTIIHDGKTIRCWEYTERRQKGGKLKDFIGCVDYLAFSPTVGILGVQATTTGHQANRLVKVYSEPRARRWLESGGKIQVWGWLWSLKTHKWEVTIQNVGLAGMPAAGGAQ